MKFIVEAYPELREERDNVRLGWIYTREHAFSQFKE